MWRVGHFWLLVKAGLITCRRRATNCSHWMHLYLWAVKVLVSIFLSQFSEAAQEDCERYRYNNMGKQLWHKSQIEYLFQSTLMKVNFLSRKIKAVPLLVQLPWEPLVPLDYGIWGWSYCPGMRWLSLLFVSQLICRYSFVHVCSYEACAY